jgi:peptidoglycan DL-endopeptidase CwlO
MGSGQWIVGEMTRTGGNTRATVTLIRIRHPLPEPPLEAPDTGGGALGLGVQTGAPPGTTTAEVERMVQFALSKAPGPYVWGGNGPRGYDCSGLMTAAAAHIGKQLVRQSMAALRQCERAGTTMTVRDGINTRGALLFRERPINGVTHIAMSLGNGRTIEARGRQTGIGSFPATTDRFDNAALVPGLAYR